MSRIEGFALWTAPALAVLVVAAVPSRGAEPAPPRPNVILVMADDVGYGDFSCNGNPVVKTPNVDAFAGEGVRFSSFHVSPTCAPSRCAIMTGAHEFRSGVTHTILERERMSLRAATIADVLKSAGYATGIFGKWHLGDEPEYQPNRRGFDETFVHGGGGIGQTYPGSCGDAPGNTYFSPTILHNGAFEKTDGYCTDVFFNRAIRWMDQVRGKGAPFFAYVSLNVAHAPLQCPEAYAKRHAGEVPEDLARFFGMIENLDDNFGALLGKVRDWGLERNTLIVFMTDNGGTVGTRLFNAGMRGGKVTPYEGGTRVPSFWRWPAGFAGGADVAALAAHVDMFPTFAEVAGVEPTAAVREQVEGRSLLPLLRDPTAPWADRVLVTHVGRWPRGKAEEFKHVKCSIRDDRFALVEDRELYDLKADPGQKRNVLDEHPEEVAKLRAAYERWWRGILPRLENEDAAGPKVNPYKALYWKQFGGGPDPETKRLMNPETTDFPGGRVPRAR